MTHKHETRFSSKQSVKYTTEYKQTRELEKTRQQRKRYKLTSYNRTWAKTKSGEVCVLEASTWCLFNIITLNNNLFYLKDKRKLQVNARMYTHERVKTWSMEGVVVVARSRTHTHRKALMTIVSGPCRGRSSLQPLINPIDLSQRSKVTGTLMGESALRSKAVPDSRQINDASVMYVICVFIYPISNWIWSFYYSVCLCMKSSAVYRAPRQGTWLTRSLAAVFFQHQWCSGQVQWCSGLGRVKGRRLSAQLHTHTQTDTQTNNQLHMRMCSWGSSPTKINPCTYWGTLKHADVHGENEDYQ